MLGIYILAIFYFFHCPIFINDAMAFWLYICNLPLDCFTWQLNVYFILYTQIQN